MRQCSFLVCVALVTLSVRSAAPPSEDPESWTSEEVVQQESVSDFQFSPGGKFVVWVKATPDREKNEHVSQLHRTDLQSGREVQLTRGSESCTLPRWAPDGSHLAFVSSRPLPKGKGDDKGKKADDPKAQVWLLDPTGGEPWPLTEVARGVQRYGWAGSDAIVFAAQEDPARRETVLEEEKKDDSHVVEDERHEPPVRLFHVEVKSRKVTRLTTNTDRIEQLAVSPDGKHAVTLHARSMSYTFDNKVKPIAFLQDLVTGKSRRILDDPKLNLSAFLWTPDSKGIYVIHEQSSKPQLNQAGVTRLLYRDLASGKEAPIDLGWPRGLAYQDDNDNAPGVVPLADGFLALLADGVRLRLARYARVGETVIRHWIEGEHVGNLFGMALSPDGRSVVYAHSTPSSPTRWFRARREADRLVEPKLIAVCNEGLAKKRFARAEVVRWKGARGEEVEGLLFHPHGNRPSRPAPLVLQIHGGPASADRDNWDERWAYSPNLLCQRGAFVLKVNYHGSASYGQAWLESISDGRYCEPEVEDIEKGVDALIARGLVDPNRLALTGWSNGAILTNAMITRTSRYRAAVAGAGSIEYVSDWASCEFGEAFDRFYLGRSPLEDPALYFRKSPFYRLERATTPTLLFFGTEDRVVHPQQGWAQYRAMQQLGKAPVRFVLFPGAKHSLKKLSHQKRKLEEEMAWLDRYLFAKDKPSEEALRPDSPLAYLLKRQSSARVGNAFGVDLRGVLIPETVRHGRMKVGRFEVTRSQFARFDSGRKVETGKENYPVRATFEEARKYCAWLTAVTGRRYRLPRSSEADELYEKPGDGDNTLDAWAGYAVNPEDAARLRRELEGLPAGALLREVGSGKGVGKEELIYDLGGNMAEWTEGKEGKGVLRGGSADTPADTRGKGAAPGENYHGFRVVLD